jgi:hypothetical protein
MKPDWGPLEDNMGPTSACQGQLQELQHGKITQCLLKLPHVKQFPLRGHNTTDRPSEHDDAGDARISSKPGGRSTLLKVGVRKHAECKYVGVQTC